MNKMNKIKNIVFDLGGVLMNLDVPRTIKAFKNLGIENIVNETGHNYQHSFFYEFEIGAISENTFLQNLSNLSKLKPNKIEIKNAWNEMILDIPKNRIDFIKNLKPNYNLFLLSNTNSIHQHKFTSEFEDNFEFSLNSLFKKAYYSHEVKIRKPDKEVFDLILNDSKLKAEETLFVDDSLPNIQSAKNTGINTFHIQNYNLFNILK
jgi:HAD superfamily hydrolase (TIGR01509 family)